MKTGISYILNRDLDRAAADLEEIAGGCDFVVHTFSETDLYFHQKNMREIIKLSRQKGLAVYLDPWGVGGVFGGETFSRFVAENPAACLKVKGQRLAVADIAHPLFRKFMKKWLRAALALKPDVIFWDEPHQSGMNYSPAEINRVVGFIKEMAKIVSKRGVKNAVCVYPRADKNSQKLWQAILEIKEVDIFGTDPYWLLWGKKLDFVEKISERVYNLCETYHKEPQIWIQAFKVPAGREKEIGKAVKMAAAAGIQNIAAWSYDAGSLVDGLNSAQPDKVWQTLRSAYLQAKRSGRGKK